MMRRRGSLIALLMLALGIPAAHVALPSIGNSVGRWTAPDEPHGAGLTHRPPSAVPLGIFEPDETAGPGGQVGGPLMAALVEAGVDPVDAPAVSDLLRERDGEAPAALILADLGAHAGDAGPAPGDAEAEHGSGAAGTSGASGGVGGGGGFVSSSGSGGGGSPAGSWSPAGGPAPLPFGDGAGDPPIQAVPEPATLAGFGSGLAAYCLRRLRCRTS